MSKKPRKRVEVAAAVIRREDGAFLLGQRAADTVYAGYWEFPGGKVEPGESPHDALVRELDEELGIRVLRARPWVVREHFYEHAHVRLHFFVVEAWSGELRSHIHATLEWQRAEQTTVSPMLPANAPVLRSLELPRVCAITHAFEIGLAAQLDALDAALGRGVRMVQVREADASLRRDLARVARERTRAASALLLINEDEALAAEVEADGVHLPARRLMACSARPDFSWVGASAHDASELAQAARLGLDFVVLGPVLPTASHVGAPGLGWKRFGQLIKGYGLPVFAIGGLGAEHLALAHEAGAQGVAGIRGMWGG